MPQKFSIGARGPPADRACRSYQLPRGPTAVGIHRKSDAVRSIETRAWAQPVAAAKAVRCRRLFVCGDCKQRSASRRALPTPQELFGLLDKLREVVANNLPPAGVVNQVVTMDQQVSKRNDLLVMADSNGCFGIGFREASDGFADDLEIAFDGLPEHAIGLVIGQGPVGGAFAYKGGYTGLVNRASR